MMLLSVVVPVYNGEKYLKACLLSLTNQIGGVLSTQNYEVIVVNDGSTDATEELIDSFVKDYPFIVKVNKENGGVSSARNRGIEAAKGDYITFVDADDKVMKNSYPSVMECILKNGLEGYRFAKARNNENDDYNLNPSFLEEHTTLCPPIILGSAHGTIYKMSVLKEKGMFFDTSLMYQEDLLFNFYYMRSIQKFGITKLTLYFYRNNTESVTGRFFAQKTNYGDLASKEYRCHLSRIIFLKRVKEYYAKNPQDSSCKIILSIMTAEYLWFAMKCLYPADTVLNDLKKNGLSVKYIKMKHLANTGGNRIKEYLLKILRYSFKIPGVYRMGSKIYRLIKR